MRENGWETSVRVTEHERLLTLGNEQGVVELEVGGRLGWLGDGHWGEHLKGWALGVMLYVGKSNSNKKYTKNLINLKYSLSKNKKIKTKINK